MHVSLFVSLPHHLQSTRVEYPQGEKQRETRASGRETKRDTCLRERNKERVSTHNTHTHKDEPSMSLHLSHQSCLSLSDESCLALSHESCLSLSQVFPSLMGHVSPSVIACVSLSILLSLCHRLHRLRLSLYPSLWSAQGYQQPQI